MYEKLNAIATVNVAYAKPTVKPLNVLVISIHIIKMRLFSCMK